MEKERTFPTVGIAIVNWNSGNQLRECLDSVLRSTSSTYIIERIVIVDNGSTDRSLDSVAERSARISVVRNLENCGFGAAANQAAACLQTDLVIFLNPDCRVEDNTLEVAIHALLAGNLDQTGVVGVRLIDEEGHTSRHCARRPTPITFWRLIFGMHRLRPGYGLTMNDWDHEHSRDVDHVMGAFYLMPLSLFREIGGFDERFFVYLEDLDLSLRVNDAGRTVHYLAEATVFHAGGGTSRQDKGARLAYMLESRIQFSFKHFGRGQAIALTLGTALIEPGIRIVAGLANLAPREIVDTCRGSFLLWCRLIGHIPKCAGTLLSRQ